MNDGNFRRFEDRGIRNSQTDEFEDSDAEYLGRARVRIIGRRPVHFNVAPRYTGGSPAAVPEETARRVAAEESEAFQRHKDGVYGTFGEKLTQLGLDGIAEMRVEGPRGWFVEDLITGKHSYRPFDATRNRTAKETEEVRAWEGRL